MGGKMCIFIHYRLPSPFHRLGNWDLLRQLICLKLKSVRRRQWHPTLVLLPGKSHEQRSLVGCSPWGREESDTTERLHFHFSLSCTGEGNGNPLQWSCLENPRDGGAWWAAVYGVAQSRPRLKQLSSEIVKSHPNLSDPMDYSLPGFSVRGISQVRVPEWGAIAFSIIWPNVILFWFPKVWWVLGPVFINSVMVLCPRHQQNFSGYWASSGEEQNNRESQ